MTRQEIAKAFASIDWLRKQSDDPEENEKVSFLKEELLKLKPELAINLLVKVIEANELSKSHPKTFHDMLEFRHINEFC